MPDDLPPLFGRPGDSGPGFVQPRLPPSNVPAEQALLGALLANNKAYDRVAGFLKPQHFSDDVNGRIYEAIARRLATGSVADPITLNAEFSKAGILDEVGGTAYLTSLLSAMVGIINAGDYGRVVLDTWMRRELINIGEFMVNESHGNGEIEATKIALDTISLIDSAVGGSGALAAKTTMLAAAMDAALDAMTLAEQTGRSAGLSTGFTRLDDTLGGLEPGLVYVIAGRPGQGKSSLGHQIAVNVARQDVGVLELSLEMSALQLGRRTLSTISGVPLSILKNGGVSQAQSQALQKARLDLYKLNLTIDDAGGQTPRQIAAKCRAAKRKPGGLGLVMVDHLNLTRAEDADAKHGATFSIEKASGTMLQIAKDCDVPVLLLAQLNRGVETRDDKRPELADLRQAGAIEQDAYAVGFVYREEYYLTNNPEQRDNESKEKFADRQQMFYDRQKKAAGRAEVIWRKVRDGQPRTDPLSFKAETASFSESQNEQEV